MAPRCEEKIRSLKENIILNLGGPVAQLDRAGDF